MQIKELKQSAKQEAVNGNPNAKSKTVAIILAIFFAYFSWIYTYKRNGLKFWLSFLGVPAVTVTFAHFVGGIAIFIGFSAAWVWVFVDNVIRPNSFFDNYPN